ncbi:MAG: hypothetical protein JXA09_12070 [Anaerolineae bacterium]|nr:hypothetical protein [Anaerolineae bacterium]
MRSQGKLFVATTAVALALCPFVVSLQSLGMPACFSSFSADAFYYLAIAKQASWTPLFSLDGIHPTNGFHPLWQWLLKGSFALVPALGRSQAAQILFVHWVGVLLLCAAAAILTLTLLRLTGNCTLSVIAVVPGLYYFVAIAANSRYGSLWSFANGMESALLLLLASILIWSMATGKLYRTAALAPYVRTSVLLSAIVLTRLDDVFLVPALLAPLLWRRKQLGSFWRYALALCAMPCLVLAAYGTVNWLYAGTFLPVSGVLKGGISIRANLQALTYALLPVEQILGSDWGWWEATTWRALQIAVPAVVAAMYLGVQLVHSLRRRASPGRLSSVIAALCLYVLGKAAYTLVNVGVWHQGHWYFVISIWVFSLILALFGGRRAIRDVWVRLAATRRLTHAFLYTAGIVSLAIIATLIVRPSTQTASSSGVWDRTGALLLLFWLGVALAAVLLVSMHRHQRTLGIPVGLGLATMLVLYMANGMLADKASGDYNEQYYRFWQNRARTAADIKALYDGAGILSFDDGIIAYSLDIPVMSGLGYALDPEGVRAKQQGELLDLAYERGFYWLTSLEYMPAMAESVEESLSSAVWLEDEDLGKWAFELAYVEPSTGCQFISFAPAAGGP